MVRELAVAGAPGFAPQYTTVVERNRARSAESSFEVKMAEALPRIEAVIFDYGEVLCYPPHPEEIARMAGIFSVEPKAFPALWQKNRPVYDLGSHTPANYWEILASDAKVKLTPDQLQALSVLDSEMWGHENPRMV